MDSNEKQAIYRLGQMDMREAASQCFWIWRTAHMVLCVQRCLMWRSEFMILHFANPQEMMLMDSAKINPFRSYYDFEICYGPEELKLALSALNRNGYEMVAVTQTMDKYTVFFRRTAA